MMKRIAIVGSGAVGGYYGARLAEAGLEVHFLLRSDYDEVRSHGWHVKSVHGDFELTSVICAQTSEEIGPVDLVVIAWKTTSNQHYQGVVTPLLSSKTQILSLQNGLGNTEELARLFGGWRVFGGLCFVCINRTSAGHLCHSAAGMMKVGSFEIIDSDASSRLEKIVTMLCAAKIDARVVANLEWAQWLKLVWNIPFNGLAIAEGGLNTEELLAQPGMESRIRKIMSEVQAVAAALGHEIRDDFLDQQIEVTKPMRAYQPSSMIDYLEGREVEVDAIWREPLRKAHQLGIETPEMERLLTNIELRIEESKN
jgi:2-dehydropantoate 2-reductase